MTTWTQPTLFAEPTQAEPTQLEHLVAQSDARRTLCGIKVNDRRNPGADLPYTLLRFKAAHDARRGPTWCAKCLEP